MVDGSRFYHRNRSPFCHSSPIRNLSPFPDGWGSWLHGWFFCMSGICTISEIFWLLCSNRAFMDRSSPFGCFGSCLLRLFCLFQFCPAFCNGLSAAFCLCVPLFGSGSPGLGHAGSKILYSLRYLCFPVVKGVLCIDRQILCLLSKLSGSIGYLIFGICHCTHRRASPLPCRFLFQCCLSVWSAVVCLCPFGDDQQF